MVTFGKGSETVSELADRFLFGVDLHEMILTEVHANQERVSRMYQHVVGLLDIASGVHLHCKESSMFPELAKAFLEIAVSLEESRRALRARGDSATKTVFASARPLNNVTTILGDLTDQEGVFVPREWDRFHIPAVPSRNLSSSLSRSESAIEDAIVHRHPDPQLLLSTAEDVLLRLSQLNILSPDDLDDNDLWRIDQVIRSTPRILAQEEAAPELRRIQKLRHRIRTQSKKQFGPRQKILLILLDKEGG